MLMFILLCFLASTSGYSDFRERKFPGIFKFGVGTSAYQVEGGWDEDGKGESIWDRFAHERPQDFKGGVNGDVASDSYHQIDRDVEMLRELGVDFYRFSISWPRVLPTGFINEPNEEGFQYYDKLINKLLKYNIEPLVTMYHFDLPQYLQDLGGWTNPSSITWFEDYSRLLYERYGHLVKQWITLNQPMSICMEGYGDKIAAPAIDSKGVADYICVKNVMLAHAKAYRLYQKEYKAKLKGSVGIAVAVNWGDPVNNKTENVEAADKFKAFTIDLFLHPILSAAGDFPPLVKTIVAEKSKDQGFPRSRLPVLTDDERQLLKGSADFIGVNHYTTVLIKPSQVEHPSPSFYDDMNVDMSYGSDWMQGASDWLKSAPYGLYKACLYLNKVYDYPVIYITEHGWSTYGGLQDDDRIKTIKEYLIALSFAIEDGTEVRGYTYWSLMDNVEWIDGISERFGLYEVDFDSENKTRKPRASALVYKHIIESKVIDEWMPQDLNISISNRRLKKNNKEEL